MMGMKLALVVLWFMTAVTPITPACDSSRPSQLSWHNNWHKSFYAYCPSGRSMSQWISFFRRCQEDRLYHLRCSPGPASGKYIQICTTTPFLNNVKKAFFSACPSHGFVTGLVSVYDQATKDRRFRFRCCRLIGYKRTSCLLTPYKNLFGTPVLNYAVPQNYTLVGVASYHTSNIGFTGFSDRRWRFIICKIQK